MTGSFRLALTIFNILALLVIVAPIVVIVIASFGETPYMRFPPQGFTLDWYAKALGDRGYVATFWNSLRIGLIVSAIAAFLAVCAAWALARHKIRGGSAIESFLLSPLTLPHIILGIAILVVTQPLAMHNNLTRLVAAHIVITTPYVLRVLIPVIAGLNRSYEEAASDLGASRWTVFRTISFPLIFPPLLSSFLIAFLISFDELILALFLAPVSRQTLPMQIYSKVEYELDPTVGAVSTLLILATIAIAILIQLTRRK